MTYNYVSKSVDITYASERFDLENLTVLSPDQDPKLNSVWYSQKWSALTEKGNERKSLDHEAEKARQLPKDTT
jgi:hypothetical protein